MENFTDKELVQILVLVKDMEDFMTIFARNIKGLSLSGFKADMLGIAIKCEGELSRRASKGPQK